MVHSIRVIATYTVFSLLVRLFCQYYMNLLSYVFLFPCFASGVIMWVVCRKPYKTDSKGYIFFKFNINSLRILIRKEITKHVKVRYVRLNNLTSLPSLRSENNNGLFTPQGFF